MENQTRNYYRLSARTISRMKERAERRAIRAEQIRRTRMNAAQRFIYDLNKSVKNVETADAIALAISIFVASHMYN